MDSKKLLVLLITAIILSSSLSYLLYKRYYYKESIVNEFDMDVEIIEQGFVGLNADADAIHFGIVTWRGGSTRHINLSNSKDYDVFIYLTKDESELSSIVTIEPNYFTLKAEEYERVDVKVKVPANFTPGNYTGKVTVIKVVPFFRG